MRARLAWIVRAIVVAAALAAAALGGSASTAAPSDDRAAHPLPTAAAPGITMPAEPPPAPISPPAQQGAAPSPVPTLPPIEAPAPLGYRIHTVYEAPDGSRVEKSAPAVLFLPTPVDVDGSLTDDQAPDVIVELGIDAGRATLRVTKLPASPEPLPLLLEAIVRDPRGSTNLEVAYGFDTLDATTPAAFQSTIQLLGASRVTSVGLDVQTVGAGSTLAVIGEVYTPGAGGRRIDPQRGRITYAPVPTAAHFAIVQGSDIGVRQQSGVDLATDVPTKATVHIADIRGNASSLTDITIDKVPNVLSVLLTDSEDGRKTYGYQASAAVSSLSLRLGDWWGTELREEFAIEIRDIPTRITLVQDTPTHATFTSSGPVGSIAAGSSEGRGIAWLDDPAYLYTTNRGGKSFAFKVLGLSRAEYDTGDPFIVDVDIKPGPFRVLIEDGSRTIGALIADLPGHVRIQFSDAAGTLDYSGSDEIERITVDITDPQGVAGRATSMRLVLDGVPTSLSLAFGSNGGRVVFDAGEADVDLVTLLLTSGPGLVVDEGFDGVVVEDLPDRYAVAVRLTGLRLASVTTNESPYALELSKKPGPFLVALRQGTSDLRIEIHDLPATLEATIDPAGSVSYTASAPIGRITAVGTDPNGIAGRATRLDLRIVDLPASLSLEFGTQNRAVVDAQGARIGSIDLLMTTGPVLEVDDGFDGVVLEDVEDHYAIVVRLRGLRLASVSTASPYSLDLRKDAGPFLVRLTQGRRLTELKLLDLPSSLQATFDPTGSLSYTASAGIARFLGELRDPSGVSGRATRLSLDVHGLPKSLSLSLPSEGSASIDANGESIGLIDLLLTSGPELEVDDGFDGVVLRETASSYALAVRLRGLKSTSVSTVAPYRLEIAKDAGPFLVDLVQQARTTRVEVLDLPDELALTFDPTGSAAYTASAPIGRITARVADPAGVSGRATSLRLDLESLPAALDVTFGAGSTVSVDAKGSAIGLIDVLLTSGPLIAVPDGFDGALLRDTEDLYAFAARLTGLRLVSVSTAAPYALRVEKTAGPFLVDLLQGARSTRVEVRDLPSTLQATLDPAGSFAYTASAPIGLVRADLVDPAGVTGRATEAHLALSSLPASLDLTFGSGSTTSLDAHGASIGLIELAMFSAPPAPALPAGFDGVLLVDTEDRYALGVRMTGLSSASVSTAAPYALSIAKQAGPFLVDLVQGARTTRVEILNLPATLSATLDPAQGSFSYEASSAISSVRADLVDPAGITGRSTRLHLLIQDLPSSLDLEFSSGGSASLDAHGKAVGLITVLATSGPALEVDDGFDGVVLEDTADHYALAVRMTGLSSASVSTTAPYTLALSKAPGPFLVRLTQGARNARITVRDLPAVVQASFDTTNGSLTYTGSAAIGSLSAVVTDPAGVVGRATLLRLDATSLPNSLTMDFGTSTAAGIDAHGQTIGLITLLATSGPTIEVDAGYDGVVMEDTPAHFALAARITGLRVARVSTGAAPYTLTLGKTPGPFLARLVQGARTTLVTINDLPSSLTATLDPAGSLSYTASATVGQISASIVDPAGVSGRATRATALLQGLPKALDISWAGGTGAVTADAKGATVGLIEVLLTSGPDVSLPADRDGLVFEDLNDRYALFARITGLKKVRFSQGPPPSFDLQTSGGRLFQVDLRTQKPAGIVTTSGLVDRLPATVSLAFSSSTSIAYRASGPVTRLTLDAYDPAGISGRANTLHAKLEGLSTALDAAWASSGTITFDALGGTIGLVEVQLTSGPNDRLDPSVDGILLNDLSDRYVVFVRVTGLQKAVGTQSPSPDVLLNTTGGRVLHVRLNQLSGGKVTYTNVTLDRLVSSVRVRMSETSAQEVFYNASAPTNSLSFETNSGDRWKLTASIGGPLPATVYFCSSDNGYCTGFAHGNPRAGAFKFSASEHTSVNLFDCKRPLNSGCVRGNASEFIQVDDWRVRHVEFDADFDDVGFSGHTYMSTQGHALQGYLLSVSGGGGGFEANFPWPFSANNRYVDWDFWGLFKSKSGSIHCPGGTSLSVRVFGIWLGVTSYLC